MARRGRHQRHLERQRPHGPASPPSAAPASPGNATGTSAITATFMGHSASALLTVTPPCSSRSDLARDADHHQGRHRRHQRHRHLFRCTTANVTSAGTWTVADVMASTSSRFELPGRVLRQGRGQARSPSPVRLPGRGLGRRRPADLHQADDRRRADYPPGPADAISGPRPPLSDGSAGRHQPLPLDGARRHRHRRRHHRCRRRTHQQGQRPGRSRASFAWACRRASTCSCCSTDSPGRPPPDGRLTVA